MAATRRLSPSVGAVATACGEFELGRKGWRVKFDQQWKVVVESSGDALASDDRGHPFLLVGRVS